MYETPVLFLSDCRAWRAGAALALLGLTSGCSDDLALPPAPDMSELVQSYAEPDGELTGQNAEDAGQVLVETIQQARTSSPTEVAAALVKNLEDLSGDSANTTGPEAEPAEPGAEDLKGSRLDIAAIARVHRICRGWGSEPTVDEAANGAMDLTATFDQDGLIPTVWGTASNCRTARGDVQLEFDGELRLHFGGGEPRVRLRSLTRVGYLFQFEGMLSATRLDDHVEGTVNAHFKVFLNGEIWLLVRLLDGTRVIAIVNAPALAPDLAEDTVSADVLTKDGRWACMINTTNASGSCTLNSDPSSAITW